MKVASLGLWLSLPLILSGTTIRAADPPPEVTVRHPVTRVVADSVDFTGRTEAAQTVELRSRVTGFLEKINFQAGSMVKKGDVLFEIDPRPYQVEVDRSEAEVRRHEVRLKRARTDLDRARELLKRSAISREEFDKAESDKDEAEAFLRVAQAAREVARLNLSWTKVTAPITGRIGRHSVDVGNLVKADDTSLATLIATDALYVYFDVDERTYLNLQKLKNEPKALEYAVRMRLANEDDWPHRGQVDFVDQRVDARTGTIRWRASLPNPTQALLPGLFVRVRLSLGAPHKALLVPISALLVDDGKHYVYVVNDKNVVERRPVKAGGEYDGQRIISEGLTAEDMVIVKGFDKLRPGQVVTPRQEDKE